MLSIAITGGIGAGKTVITDYLESQGYVVIDADVIARKITAPGGKAIDEIAEKIGAEYITPDGSMDRDRMRALVYDDPFAKAILEDCTTRVVQEELESILSENREKGMAVTFAAVPLLFEKGGAESFDAVWLVVADEETRIRRVQARDGLDRDTIKKIINNQFSDEKKLALSTDVLYNNDCVQEIYKQVERLLRKYKLK